MIVLIKLINVQYVEYNILIKTKIFINMSLIMNYLNNIIIVAVHMIMMIKTILTGCLNFDHIQEI